MEEEEAVIAGQRVFGCECIQQMGILLRLPQVAVSTAQVMFHRFYAKRSIRKFDVRHFSLGALFLASKVEECPRKVRDILNVYTHIQQKRAGEPSVPLDIYSNRYAALKERLIKAEREILKELGFILYTEHPHKFILNYVKLLTVDEHLTKKLAQHAWNFINDSQRTDVCIHFAPEVICCAAIWMAARVLQIKLPSDASAPPWWELFNTRKHEMDAVCKQITALYSQPRAKFILLEPPPAPAPADAPATPAAPPAAAPPAAAPAAAAAAPPAAPAAAAAPPAAAEAPPAAAASAPSPPRASPPPPRASASPAPVEARENGGGGERGGGGRERGEERDRRWRDSERARSPEREKRRRREEEESDEERERRRRRDDERRDDERRDRERGDRSRDERWEQQRRFHPYEELPLVRTQMTAASEPTAPAEGQQDYRRRDYASAARRPGRESARGTTLHPPLVHV
ncbi:hypothetical protein AB1Y20_011568 [Prymnesium parvum]|uniref:Cyclin-like domain-containing protein n=1 Tax=Prymnesium parvum TaxID=97485 RepID=A0AB34IK58_PRYPA